VDIFDLHPLPWRVVPGWLSAETAGLEIHDANDATVCMVADHAADRPADWMPEHTEADWRVANAIVAAFNPEETA
jgi:hypothetical protein